MSLQKTHEGEHHGDYGNTPIKLTRSAVKFAVCAALNSCNLGYDVGVSTEAGVLIQEEMGLSRLQREIFIGSLNFWAMFGALGAQWFTDRFGRRRTFVVAAIGFIVGILITIMAQTYEVLLVGRFVVGIGVGVGLAVDPLYIAEITPAKYRGEMVTMAEIALNVGIVFAFSTGLFLGGIDGDTRWRIMLLLGCIMPVVLIICVFTIMPESPRWLVANDRAAEAKEILRKVYPDGYDVEPILQDIHESIERDTKAENAVGWSVIFRPTPAFRRMLLIGAGTAVAQQAVGIDAIQYYLLDVIGKSGIDSQEKQSVVLVVLGLVKLVFIFVGAKLFDKKGRRPLFFASLIGMAISLAIVGVALAVESNLTEGAVISGLAGYLAFFSIGMGPGGWLVPSEVFTISIRAKAMSVATFLNRATATLMASTFLSTAHAMGFGEFFILLCIVCLVVLGFLYKFLPETKGRSLEEMSWYFAEITGDKSILEAEAELVRRRPDAPPQATPPAVTQGEVI